MKENLKLFKNLNYSAVTRIIAFAFQGVSNIILARTLSSSDYGVVGIAIVFINLLNLFNDFGIQNAVIQKQNLDERTLYSAFSLKVFLGVFLFLFVWLLVPFVSHLFGFNFESDAVLNVLKILALNFLVNIFIFLPNLMLSRELDYKKLSAVNLIYTLGNSLIVITLAINGFKYWSIVLANLGGTVMLACAINVFKPVKLKWYWDEKQIKSILSYSFYLFASGITTFMIFNVDNLVIGAIRGSAILGYYAIAFSWSVVICSSVSSIMAPVFFPIYSKIQTDRNQIRQSYIKTLEYVGCISIMAYGTLFIIAKGFLVEILGHGSDKWLPALAALKILCFYGMLRSFLEPIGNIIMAVGKTRVIYKATLLAVTVELILLYPALKYFNIEGVALVVTFSYILQYFVYLPFLKEEFKIYPFELFKILKPALISLGVILTGYFLLEHFASESSIVLLAEEIILTIFGYTLAYGISTNWRIARDVRSLMSSTRN